MGIRFKLFIPTFFLLAAVSLLMHFFWLPHYQASEVEKQFKHERAYIRLLDDALVADILVSDLARVKLTLDRVIASRDNWYEIKLYNKDNNRIYPLVEKALADGINLEVLQQPIRFNNSKIANILVWIDIESSISENIKFVRYLEQLLLSLLLGVALVTAIFQDRWIRNPLKKLTTYASEIEKGNYEEDLDYHSHDEVGELVDSFNSMRQQIGQREKELYESELRYRAVIDNAVDGIITINSNGIVQSCNDATESMFGYSADKVIGQNVKMLMPEPYKGQHDGYINNYLTTNEKHIIGIGRQVEGQRRDGTRFALDLAVSEIEVGGERLFIGITRDISERVRDDEIRLHYSMALEQLHGITSSPEINFGQKVNALLKLGRGIFSLPVAIVARVKGERYIVECSSGPDGEIEPGTEFVLGETYCCHTLAAGRPTGFHHVGESDIYNHPCYKKFSLEAYLGVPLYVGNKLYGTLNFSSSKAREKPFTSADESIIQLFSQWLGTEMARNKAETELEELSRTDGLTGIANRRYFDEVLSQELNRAMRYHSALSLIICDIDHFKNYNDTYGHQAGDVCLQKVSGAMSSAFSRAGELVARYGGEEFAIIVPKTGEADAVKMAEQMRNNVFNLHIAHEASSASQYVTVSVGVATLVPNQNSTMSVLIELADNALYQAKEKGRNNVQVFS